MYDHRDLLSGKIVNATVLRSSRTENGFASVTVEVDGTTFEGLICFTAPLDGSTIRVNLGTKGDLRTIKPV